MKTNLENRKLLTLETIARIQNFMDCDVLAEANGQIQNAKTKSELLDGIEYALSAISYRSGDRSDCVEVYTTNTQIIKELKKEIENVDEITTLREIADNESVVKAYITPDEKFLKVENKNGAVFSIWQHTDKYIGGYVMTQPIKPNLTTGSAVYVAGGEWDSIAIDKVLAILATGQNIMPNFFSDKDREATHFLTIEQAVDELGNILQYKKIK